MRISTLKRPFFTLLEMMVVLLILSTGAALTGVKVKQAFDEQQKLSDVQQLINLLNAAQDLMLLMDADVEVLLTRNEKNKQISCQLFIDKALDKNLAVSFEKPIFFKTIDQVEFQEKVQSPLKLRFSLTNMSQGMIVLSMKKSFLSPTSSNEKVFIYLSGYPQRIEQTGANQSIGNIFPVVCEQLYPQEVYDALSKK